MYIKSISFVKKPTNGEGWKIDKCVFNKINLITGQNSSGKTRLLRSIQTLVSILSDTNKKAHPAFDFYWNISLEDAIEKRVYDYSLEISKGNVVFEQLYIDNKEYFSRDENGKGQILYESAKDLKLDFEIENQSIALVKKRDKTQHPSLEKIFEWIDNVYLYRFGAPLGRNVYMSPKLNIDEDKILQELDKKDDAVVLKYEKAFKEFGVVFRDEVISDFNSIGYNICEINTTKLNKIVEKLPDDILSSIPSVLYIKENGIEDKILQEDISQGMFRVLSLIIQIKYLKYTSTADVTILIDDIGEGLDYERATKVIQYIIKNAKRFENRIQLVMTTNDRFTMNQIPLDYWIIINKNSNGEIQFYTKEKNRECFEDFEDIGLNNFDFFSGKYYEHCMD
jgi:AAA15 family ATPase/GTPase